MLFTIELPNSSQLELETDENDPISLIKHLIISLYSEIPLENIHIYYRNGQISDLETLKSIGYVSNDVLQIVNIPPGNGRMKDISRENASVFEYVKEFVLNNPKALTELEQRNPILVQSLLSNDRDRYNSLMNQHKHNSSNGKQIAQNNRMNRIIAERQRAAEMYPESFTGPVSLLFVPCRFNGVDFNAFIDTGAQTSILSQKTAEKLGLMDLVDPMFGSLVKGVGNGVVIGRVHSVAIEFNSIEGQKYFFTHWFSILGGEDDLILLGMDFLRRFGVNLNLANRTMSFPDGPIVNFVDGDFLNNPLAQDKENPVSLLMKSANISKNEAIQLLRESGGRIDIALRRLAQQH
eukprot:TRINITY_DN1278_c0_g1_i1.p1 TRINITY_DN1278_c0_g1~~TRINITY_DN1278_c0_g1_i1.p1  ORF type:complete len:367 (+),score=105.27 TRINITY_DN1278_c0_g1_i1:52-1101(+)